jgi:mannose-6-phosphate isomerase-like protein (cupin superfamily)
MQLNIRVMSKKITIIDPAEVAPLMLRDGRIASRRLVTRKKDGSQRMSFHVNVLQAGRSVGVVYPEQDEINYMVRGEAIVSFDGERHRVREGMIWNIPAGCAYDIENEAEIELVSVFSPPRE